MSLLWRILNTPTHAERDQELLEALFKMNELSLEVERLRAERASDQQRLFHYEGEIERLRADLKAQCDLYRHDAAEWHDENAKLRRDLEIWRRNGGDDLMRAEIVKLRALLHALMTNPDGSHTFERAKNEALLLLELLSRSGSQ
jgi:hypothetical protein